MLCCISGYLLPCRKEITRPRRHLFSTTHQLPCEKDSYLNSMARTLRAPVSGSLF